MVNISDSFSGRNLTSLTAVGIDLSLGLSGLPTKSAQRSSINSPIPTPNSTSAFSHDAATTPPSASKAFHPITQTTTANTTTQTIKSSDSTLSKTGQPTRQVKTTKKSAETTVDDPELSEWIRIRGDFRFESMWWCSLQHYQTCIRLGCVCPFSFIFNW